VCFKTTLFLHIFSVTFESFFCPWSSPFKEVHVATVLLGLSPTKTRSSANQIFDCFSKCQKSYLALFGGTDSGPHQPVQLAVGWRYFIILNKIQKILTKNLMVFLFSAPVAFSIRLTLCLPRRGWTKACVRRLVTSGK